MEDETRSLLEQYQRDVDDVRDIMRENVIRAGERRENLDELDQRAAALLERSMIFAKTTRTLSESQHRQNMKWKVGCGILCLFIVVIIIILVVAGIYKHWI